MTDNISGLDLSYRNENDHSPTVESIQDCADFDEMPVTPKDPLHVPNSGSMNRETLLLDSSGELIEQNQHTNETDEYINHFATGVVHKGAKSGTALRIKNEGKMSTFKNGGQELDDTYALREKVTELEKIVALQSDEIACLKSAMADNLRRLQTLEESSRSKQLFMQQQQKMRMLSSRMSMHNIAPLQIAEVDLEKSRLSVCSPNYGSTKSKSMLHLDIGPTSPTDSAASQASKSSGSGGRSNTGYAVGQTRRGHTRLTPDAARTGPRGLHSRKSAGPDRLGGSSFTMAVGRASNSTNQSSPALNNLGTSNKEVVYNKEEGTLKIFIKGRPVHLPVPNSAQPIDLDSPGQLPNETLRLEWVYGYRGRDARCNIYHLPTGEVVYFVAAVVVLYNVEEQTQRHYLGHNDDVKSIAVHPDKITIATGQVAGHSKPHGKPHVRIWSSVNLSTLHIIGLGEFERSVCCLAFSQADGGSLLAAVDEANEHVLSVWSWDKEKKVTESKCSAEPILSVEWHPTDIKSLVTCGKNHFAFWTLETDTHQLSRKMAVYEKHEKPKFVLCQLFTDSGQVVTGDSSGNIVIWNRETHKVDRIVVGAHEGPIFSLMPTRSDTLLSGGGKDRAIREWDCRTLASVSSGVDRVLSEVYGPVRTLSAGPGGMVLVGTTKNCILQMFAASADQSELRALVEAHTEELWGLASHPRQHRFASVGGGNDHMLCYWDSLTRRLIWRRDLLPAGCAAPEFALHCVCFHPSEELLVVGCTGGRWLLVDTVTRETVRVHSDGGEQIECVQFSPDGQMLAVGSRDNSIYVYAVSEAGTKFSRIGRCSGHSSFVTHLDWTCNSQFIRSNSGDYELLFWTAASCKQVPSVDMVRDLEWSTTTCVLDWSAAGIWPPGADGTDVNAVARAHQLPLLCSADDFGNVNLFNHPCPQNKAPHHEYRGHSSHVTNVQFLFDDSRIISSGGKDSSLMQWEIQ